MAATMATRSKNGIPAKKARKTIPPKKGVKKAKAKKQVPARAKPAAKPRREQRREQRINVASLKGTQTLRPPTSEQAMRAVEALASPPKPRRFARFRSAVNGLFVTTCYAVLHPWTTYRDVMQRRADKRKAR